MNDRQHTVTGLVVITLMLALSCSVALAQTSGQQSLAASMDVQVFPAAGQAKDQQSRDEAECYNWAVDNTGVDPFEVQNQAAQEAQQAEAAQQQASQASAGSGARGALRGAAAGAVVGEIGSGDASKGAA